MTCGEILQTLIEEAERLGPFTSDGVTFDFSGVDFDDGDWPDL